MVESLRGRRRYSHGIKERLTRRNYQIGPTLGGVGPNSLGSLAADDCAKGERVERVERISYAGARRNG